MLETTEHAESGIMSGRAFDSVCAFVAAMALWQVKLMAQAEPRGSIEGIVVSRADNEALAGATIVVRSGDTPRHWSAITDAAGAFRIPRLPLGLYEVLIFYADAKARMVGIQVSAASITRVWPKIDFSLIPTTCCCFSGKPLISLYDNSIRTTIKSADIALVPYLEPSFGSSVRAHSEHLYLVDGVNRSGLPHLAYVNLNFVETIDVTVTGAEVQTPCALGTIREVLLESGRNDLRGSIWAQMRQKRAANSMQIGTTISGPLEKDKAWFFQGVMAELAQRPISKASSPNLNLQWLTRLDYAPTLEHRGSLRYILTTHGDAVVDDLGAKWTSKLFDAKTTFATILGFHHGTSKVMRDRRLSTTMQWRQTCGLSLRANAGSIARSRANLRLRYLRQLDNDQSLEVFTEIRSAGADAGADTGATATGGPGPGPSLHQGLRFLY